MPAPLRTTIASLRKRLRAANARIATLEDELSSTEANGDVLMETRACISDRLGHDAQFFDDVIEPVVNTCLKGIGLAFEHGQVIGAQEQEIRRLQSRIDDCTYPETGRY